MKKWCLLFLLFIGLLWTGPASAVYWDYFEDFDTSVNPSGPWTYGMQDPNDPNGVIVYDLGFPRAADLTYWVDSKIFDAGADVPCAACNNHATASYYGLPAQKAALHPGYNSVNSIVRWTAPQAGDFYVYGSFGVGDGGSVGCFIRINGSMVVSEANTASAVPFDFPVTVAAGDTIDFIVSDGDGSVIGDMTPLSARIDTEPYVPPVEPNEPQNLWDLSADFNIDGNPNGQWSYAYATHARLTEPNTTNIIPPDTSEVTLMPRAAVNHEGALLTCWFHPVDNWPYIGIAPTAGSCWGVWFEQGEIGLHPGNPSESVMAIARWTAPREGDIVVTGQFEGVAPGTRDFYLIFNHTNVLASQYSVGYSILPFEFEMTVAAGDTIDMCIGKGTAWGSNMGKFEETISYPDLVTCADQNVYLPFDFNKDCYVNLGDFVIFAGEWLTCNDPQNDDCPTATP